MKKLLSFVIAALTALAFAGCGGENSSIDNNTSSTDSASVDVTNGSVKEPSESTKPEETTDKKEVEANGEYVSNGVLINGDGDNIRAIELYGGSFDIGSTYAATINKYKESLGDMVNVYNMCIPTAFAYYLPTKLENEYASQYDNIRNIQSQLKNVIDVDIYDTLSEHSDEYIYFRTDHHWQPIGAYYAAQVFAERAGITQFPDISTYQKVVYEGFLGSLEGYAQSNELAAHPDVFTYYKPANLKSLTTTYYDTSFSNPVESSLFFDDFEMKNAYSTFLGDDREIAKIDTNVQNGRTLVVFKDSFGNALIPFFTQSFEHIYVCDIRYFDLNSISFCKNVGATDVLFATCMFTCTGGNSNLLSDLMNQ